MIERTGFWNRDIFEGFVLLGEAGREELILRKGALTKAQRHQGRGG
jgi:hypothetical protein